MSLTALNAEFGFILEYVTDIPGSTRFFVDVLGLRVERTHPTFVQFTDTQGRRFAIASDESLSVTRAPEIYWLVADAEAAYAACASTDSVTVSRPLEQRPFGKVFALTDPAGQPHFILEFAKRRPSEQVS